MLKDKILYLKEDHHMLRGLILLQSGDFSHAEGYLELFPQDMLHMLKDILL
jgi:hypothetical protein